MLCHVVSVCSRKILSGLLKFAVNWPLDLSAKEVSTCERKKNGRTRRRMKFSWVEGWEVNWLGREEARDSRGGLEPSDALVLSLTRRCFSVIASKVDRTYPRVSRVKPESRKPSGRGGESLFRRPSVVSHRGLFHCTMVIKINKLKIFQQ